MPDPNMMKSMIVIEYDILPEIEINIDMLLILPNRKRRSIFIVLCVLSKFVVKYKALK